MVSATDDLYKRSSRGRFSFLTARDYRTTLSVYEHLYRRGMPLEGFMQKMLGCRLKGPCKFDLKDVLKEPAEIFKVSHVFASSVAEGDQVLAERLTRKNMKALPHWQAHLFPLP